MGKMRGARLFQETELRAHPHSPGCGPAAHRAQPLDRRRAAASRRPQAPCHCSDSQAQYLGDKVQGKVTLDL